MDIKTAILRGINVGGHRKILMADLKQLLEKNGFLKNVATYIQSGNVVFNTDEENSVLELKLEALIKSHFGHDVPVIVRSKEELLKVIEHNPFKAEEDITKLHVTFLKEQPQQLDIDQISADTFKPDLFSIEDKTVYLCLKKKYHETKLSTNFFEKNLQVGATTRNWKTTLKLLELCNKLS